MKYPDLTSTTLALPIDCLDFLSADGTYMSLDVWSAGVTWQYIIRDSRNDSSAAALRDAAIIRAIRGGN